MSGITTATVIAGIGAAASVASGISSIMGGSPKASGAAATGEVNKSANQAASARSLLLETAGGSSGSNLQPGQVADNKNNIFGN